MGEHVKAGEKYLSGCLRGFKEELNLNLQPKQLKFIKKFPPSHNLGYFRAVYIYRSEEVPEYNPEDFSGYSWLLPSELLKILEAGEPAKLSLAETLSYLIGN